MITHRILFFSLLVFYTLSVQAMEENNAKEQKKMVRLKAGDKKAVFVVDQEIIDHFSQLNNMIELSENNDKPIRLHNITTPILQKVINLLKNYDAITTYYSVLSRIFFKNEQEENEQEKKFLQLIALPLDQDLNHLFMQFNTCSQEELIEILDAANYLACKPLLDAAINAYAKRHKEEYKHKPWASLHAAQLPKEIDALISSSILNRSHKASPITQLTTPITKLIKNSKKRFEKITFSPQHSYLISLDREGKLKLWNTKTTKLVKEIDTRYNSDSCFSDSISTFFCMSHDESTFTLGDEVIHYFSTEYPLDIGKVTQNTPLKRVAGHFWKPIMNHDGTMLAAFMNDNGKTKIFLSDLKNFSRKLATHYRPSISKKKRFGFSPDGKTFAYFTDSPHEIALINTKSGKEYCITSEQAIIDFNFTPHTTDLIVISHDEKSWREYANATIELWNLQEDTNSYQRYALTSKIPFPKEFPDNFEFCSDGTPITSSRQEMHIFDLEKKEFLIYILPQMDYTSGMLVSNKKQKPHIILHDQETSTGIFNCASYDTVNRWSTWPTLVNKKTSYKIAHTDDGLYIAKAFASSVLLIGPFANSKKVIKKSKKLSADQSAFIAQCYNRATPLTIHSFLPSGNPLPTESYKLYASLPSCIKKAMSNVIETHHNPAQQEILPIMSNSMAKPKTRSLKNLGF